MKGGRCTPQSLESAFYLFAGFAFLNLYVILYLSYVLSVFYFFPQLCFLVIFSRRSVTAVWGCQKCFIRNNMEVLKVMGDNEELVWSRKYSASQHFISVHILLFVVEDA